MLTRRMAAPMMRRGGRRMRQMQELREENARLKAQVVRLQNYAAEIAEHLPIDVTDYAMRDSTDRAMLQDSDLDEPHGAASEKEGE